MATASHNPRPAPLFVGDHLALDFLNSTASPWGERIEWLDSGADLLDWLTAAGAIATRVAKLFRTQDNGLRTLDTVAEQARGLREWFRGFVQRYAGKPLTAAVLPELKPLNRLVAQDAIYRRIDAADAASREKDGGDQALDWREERLWRTPEQLLMPIAQAIGDLVCHVDFRLVRSCEGESCTLVFYDRTKSHARRWCSMAVCGNRAKAAAHRARSRAKSYHSSPKK
jgi:predicted RNA-binding Zn ribbon-like protein